MKQLEAKIKVSYDQQARRGYIYLEEIPKGGVEKSVQLEDKILDFDAQGRLIGIEFLEPENTFPKSLWKLFELK